MPLTKKMKALQELLKDYNTLEIARENNHDLIHALETELESEDMHETDKEQLRMSCEARRKAYREINMKIKMIENALSILTDREQRVIQVYHWSGLSRSRAIALLCDEMYCSESTVKRTYSKLMDKLGKMLIIETPNPP